METMMVRPGEIIEFAWWLTGYETREDLEAFAEGTRAAILGFQDEHGVLLSSPHAVTKYPGDERVPEVPDHIQGPDVRLLVAEAKVLCNMPDLVPPTSLFTEELEADDLRRLRKITRDGYARMMAQHGFNPPPLTDRQCDTIINDLGPEAALDALRANDVDVLKVLH